MSAVEVTTPAVRKTALNAVHRQMGAKMVEFNGWDMPVEYPASIGGGIISEHMAVRTAICSEMIPPPEDAGYSTGMSQPLNSTILAPIRRWTALRAVLRMAGA